ncbi:hypothetical protein PVAG01_09241 [Phlyctema vagabunda]|uniref:Transposase n=1 Tax=Phlyctema vagabunda TaxID=108571 RepID=A0ABR4P6W2_9HELO
MMEGVLQTLPINFGFTDASAGTTPKLFPRECKCKRGCRFRNKPNEVIRVDLPQMTVIRWVEIYWAQQNIVHRQPSTGSRHKCFIAVEQARRYTRS